MAITFVTSNNVSSVTPANTSPQTLTSLINLPDTTGVTIVGIAFGSVNPANITSVTLGGQTVTALTNLEAGTGGGGGVWLGRILNSLIGSTGLKNLVISWTIAGQPALSSIGAAAACFTGQDGTTPAGTPQSNSAASGNGSLTFTDSVSGEYAFCFGCNGQGITAAAPDNVVIANLDNESAAGNYQYCVTAGTGSNISFTQTQTSDWWAITATAVQQAAAAATYTQTKFQLFNNDGTGTGPA